jgi:hypothetical protein
MCIHEKTKFKKVNYTVSATVDKVTTTSIWSKVAVLCTKGNFIVGTSFNKIFNQQLNISLLLSYRQKNSLQRGKISEVLHKKKKKKKKIITEGL